MDATFRLAVQLFSEQEFFACHDVLEELWSEAISEEKAFLQGLIHVAVALFHFGEGNLAGARKMHDSALRYLSAYPDDYYSIDLKRLKTDVSVCFQPLTQSDSGYPIGATLNSDLIPQLHYSTK